MLQSGSLCVVPQAVVFEDVKPGCSESKEIFVHNIGKKPIRVRFTMPTNPCFAFIGNTSMMTAPGLEMKCSVRYFAIAGKSNSCILKIQTADESIDLPISASMPKPQIKFDVENIDMGITSPNLNIKKLFNIANYGNKECSISLSTNNEKLKVEPKSIRLQSNEEQELQLTFSASVPGNYDFIVNAKAKEEKIVIQPVKVTVKVIDHEVVMMYEDKEINEINFGHIYFSQRRVLQITIKNKCATTRSFILLPPHEPSNINSISRAPSTFDDPDIIFTAVPCEGVLKPFSSTVVSFIFGPPSLTEIGESDQMFNHLSTLKVVETKQTFDFQLTGIAISPDFLINQVDFNFGRQIVRTKKSKSLIIENRSQFLPISFNIKEVAQFRFIPHTGTIKPKEKKEISVTFFPHNLGDFELSTTVDISRGLAKRKLNLTGVSVAKDLENKKFKRVPIYETDKTANFNVLHPSNEYGMSIEEIRRKKELRDEFDGYLTTSARKREEAQKKKEALRKANKDSNRPLNGVDFKDYIMSQLKKNIPDADEDPVNLGLEHCAGMKPPDPPLIKGGNNFVVSDPSKMGLLSTKLGTIPPIKKTNFNDKIMIPTKYKPKPTTSPEQDECCKALDPVRLMKIAASHQTINFGIVSVYSTEKRSFEITNSLNQHILVTLKIEDEELKQSSPLSQVVPPQQTAGFDITLYGTKPQNFLKQIVYMINENHEFSVNIAAQIVTIDVRLSKETINFKFPENVVETSVTESLTLYNKSNSVVHFNWTHFNAVFSVNYESGTIQPNCSQACEIKYHPGTEAHSEITAVLNVVGGSQRSLKLIGDMGKPKLSLEKKQISFGIVPLEKPRDVYVKLKNNSHDPAIYSIINPNEDVLTIYPMIGKIKPGENQLLQVSVLFNSPTVFQSKVSVVICGASPISFLVTATAEMPNVEVSYSDLDFGQLYIGSSSSRQISIKNSSKTPAVFLLDLSEHPSFHLEFPSHLGIREPTENGNSVMLVTSSESSNDNVSSNASKLTSTELTGCSTSSLQSQESDDYTHSYTYKITVVPDNTVDVYLVFQPKKVGKYSFELPISLLYVPESSKKSAIKSPQQLVKGESIHAPILPSDSVIDFGISPIYDKDNPNSCFTTRQLVLKNESEIPVNFHFDTDYGGTSETFIIKPVRGRIDYSKTMSILITFKPLASSPYSKYLPLYVNTDKGESLISKIQLVGVGTSRKFKTSTDSVCFMAVPLGVKIEKTIDVINTSYNITILKVTAAVSEKAFPISFHFPKGNRFTYTVPKLPLTISFQSNSPVNFTTTAAILDTEGNTYSFSISAATDNSIFTLYPFLSFGNYNVQTQGKGGPIIASLNNPNIESDFLSTFLSASDISQVEHIKPQTTPLMTSFLVNFLNTLVFTSTKINSIPGDFINDGGNLVAEMISNLSERTFSFQSFQLSNSILGASKTTIDNNMSTLTTTPASSRMKNMVHYLMSQGAFLSNIRPEFLLTKNEFLDVVRIQITKKLLGIDYYGAPPISSFDSDLMDEFTSSQSFSAALLPRLKIAEHLFPSISLESWTTVILQVIKLYMFNKISIDSFLSTAGTQEALKKLREKVRSDVYSEINRSTKSLLTSNIFSPVESMLLKWSSLYYCIMNPNDVKVFLDFKDLRDPLVFLALFQAHLSESKSIDIVMNPKKVEDHEKNMKKITDFMNQVHINYCPSTKEILEGNNCMIALIIALLYETLPHFIPSSSLNFNIPLCSRKIQTVSITNPSRYEITYNASIQGASNFSLIRNSIKIGANETAGFEVQYIARKHTTERATLILTPNKPKMNDLSDVKNQPQTTRNATSKLSKPSKSSLSNQIKRPNSARSASTVDASTFASTIVVNLTASTVIKGPFKSIEIEGPLYQPSKTTISIENAPKIPGKFRLYSRYFHISDENGQHIGENVPLSKQISNFLEDPLAEPSFITATSKFAQTVQQHQAFLFSTKEIEFKDDSTPAKVDLEFVPISLGTYRCLVLFYNDYLGEFIYEIVGIANLPNEIETNLKYKIESDQSKTSNLNFDIVNKTFFFAMSYSICKQVALTSYVSESKFKDLLNFHIREIQSNFLKLFVSIEYKVTCSAPQYFSAPSPFLVDAHHAALPLTFSPKQPGDYHCRVVLISDYDARVFVVTGQALLATKTLLIEMNTVCGRLMTQNLPIMNPSDALWHFKTHLRGDEGYSVIGRFDVSPHSTFQLPLQFISKDKGLYNALLTVTNYTKETSVKYNISSNVEDAPAENKFTLKGKAKENLHYSFQVAPFIENGIVNVTSTIPILSFNDKLEFSEDFQTPTFSFDAYAVRNGFAAGMITFHDPHSYRSVFYIVEISFDSPDPEETIEVKTTSRQSVTIKIPVHNPSSECVVFDVLFTEEDFFGDKTIEINPNETKVYELVFSPLRSMERTSYISFLNDDQGEFVYELSLKSEPPGVNALAPLSTPIGKHQSTTIAIENPLDKKVLFKVENENPHNFQVVSNQIISINAKEKKSIEVRYLPSSIGKTEMTVISFVSREAGEWHYKLSGVGKPPQPLSPIILESKLYEPASASITFSNPFPFLAKFEASIATDSQGTFSFLSKKSVFTLPNYGDEYSIAISFMPKVENQFNANVIVRLISLENDITWTFPLIGTTIAERTKHPELKGEANTIIEGKFELPLVAESEKCNFNEYKLTVGYPSGYDWLSKILTVRPIEVISKNNSPCLIVLGVIKPLRPIEKTVSLDVTNPLNQTWHFTIDLKIRKGKIMNKIVMESNLKIPSAKRIEVDQVFPVRTAFHVYFAVGSSTEFSVSPSQGYIEPSLEETRQLPFDVIFCPQVYGKLLRGLLVIDMLEQQILVEVFGKVPDYVPPVIKTGRIDTTMPASARRFAEARCEMKKRNIIKENIESVRTPRSGLRVKQVPRKE